MPVPRNTQQFDRVSLSSDIRLPSKVESSHFPSMDTEFSPLKERDGRGRKQAMFTLGNGVEEEPHPWNKAWG